MKRREFLAGSLIAAAAPSPASAAEKPRIWAEENERNVRGVEMFRVMINEAFKPDQYVAAHHLIYQIGSETQEFPSADTLIFNHHVARIIWGDGFKDILAQLAREPSETRDALLATLLRKRSA